MKESNGLDINTSSFLTVPDVVTSGGSKCRLQGAREQESEKPNIQTGVGYFLGQKRALSLSCMDTCEGCMVRAARCEMCNSCNVCRSNEDGGF